MQSQLEDKQEHLQLLQAKLKDDQMGSAAANQLAKLRGKNLDIARTTVTQLRAEIVMKDNAIRAAERVARAKETEERALYMAQKEEIGRLNGQVETMQVLVRGKERQMVEVERDFRDQKAQTEGLYQAKIRDLEQLIDSLKKSQKDS